MKATPAYHEKDALARPVTKFLGLQVKLCPVLRNTQVLCHRSWLEYGTSDPREYKYQLNLFQATQIALHLMVVLFIHPIPSRTTHRDLLIRLMLQVFGTGAPSVLLLELWFEEFFVVLLPVTYDHFPLVAVLGFEVYLNKSVL